jgi:hypothetical protein
MTRRGPPRLTYGATAARPATACPHRRRPRPATAALQPPRSATGRSSSRRYELAATALRNATKLEAPTMKLAATAFRNATKLEPPAMNSQRADEPLTKVRLSMLRQVHATLGFRAPKRPAEGRAEEGRPEEAKSQSPAGRRGIGRAAGRPERRGIGPLCPAGRRIEAGTALGFVRSQAPAHRTPATAFRRRAPEPVPGRGGVPAGSHAKARRR